MRFQIISFTKLTRDTGNFASYAAALAMTLTPFFSHANPQNGVVSAGSATISSSGNTLNVNQTSDKAIIDWRSFDINTDEATKFNQPSSSSVALNRVNSTSPSQILGSLSANGNIILVNPNGVFFGKNSVVDVNGIIATTANISNSDFMAGTMKFSYSGNSNGAIINQGTITAKDMGLVGLVAPYVENSGTITAKLGKVVLGSGDSFTLDMAGDNLIDVAVTGPLQQQIVSNSGTIKADGGTVLMTAAAARDVVDSTINNTGLIQANSFKQKNGEIILYAEGSNAVSDNTVSAKGTKTGTSKVTNSGTLSATGKHKGQSGGSISVLADDVEIKSGSIINASGANGGGNIKIGGDLHGEGITPTALTTRIEQNSIIKADALDEGNGGQIAVWSDNATDFEGSISAKGGIIKGDGGYVETSGHILNSTGTVNASATNGLQGEWLLDPYNVTIESYSGINTSAGSSPNFAATGTGAIVSTESIDNALNNGTSVTITTGTTGAENGDITVVSAIAKTTGTDATLSLKAAHNIIISDGANITSTAGKLNLLLDSDALDTNGSATGAINIGTTTGVTITTNGGNIIMGGGTDANTMSAIGNSDSSNGILLTDDTINSGAGNIIMNGHGYNNAATLMEGIQLQSTKVQTTSGTITMNGTGGNGTTYNIGVAVTTGSSVVTGNGDISITGNGGTGGTTNDYHDNYGVYVNGTGSKISSTSGNVTVIGNGANSYSSSAGVNVTSSGAITTGGSMLSVKGTGGNGAGGNSFGVYINGFITNTSNSNGSLTVTGIAGSGSGSEHGILMSSGTISSSGSGTMLVKGTSGAGSGAAISIDAGSTISDTASSGTMTVTGNGATGSSFSYGMLINGTISTIGANATVSGAGVGTGSNNYGINLSGGTIKSTGIGTLTVSGTGGNGSIGNYGVYIQAAGKITTTTRSLCVTGNGAAGGTNSGYHDDYGIYISGSGSKITSTSGNVTVSGTGAAAYSNNYGIDIDSGGLITTGGTSLIVNGSGGKGTNINNYGIFLSSGTISSTAASGVATINGNGGTGNGNETGIQSSSSTISAIGSNININGTALATNGNDSGFYLASSTVYSAGGNIAITSAGGNGSTDLNANSASTIGGASETGNITLIQNIASWNSLVLNTSGAIYIQPRTNVTSISIAGGGSNTLGITSTFLNSILGASNISIGTSSGTGAVNVGAYTWNRDANIINGTGGITVSGAQSSNSKFFLQTGASDITLNSTISSNATGTAIKLVSGRNFINTAGSSALTTSIGRWLIYSTSPDSDIFKGLNASFNRYSCIYGGSCPTIAATGNGILYSYTPMLSVQIDDISRSFATSNPTVPNGYTITGWLSATDQEADKISGTFSVYSNARMFSGIGTYSLNEYTSTLLSEMGYGFTYIPGKLDITSSVIASTNILDKVSVNNFKDEITGNSSLKRRDFSSLIIMDQSLKNNLTENYSGSLFLRGRTGIYF